MWRMNISMLPVEFNRARGLACSSVADEETRLIRIDAHVQKGRRGDGGGGGGGGVNSVSHE